MTGARPRHWLVALAALLLLFSGYVQVISANATDKNWLLIAAQMWLQGKHLYHDIFEINPPLILMIYTIPVWLSGYVGFLSPYNMLGLFGIAVTLGSIALCVRLIALHPAFAQAPGKRLAFALLLAFVFIFFTAPMFFFDREHILLVLTFPYVLRFMPALARQPLPLWLRVLIGVLAAIGFCMKPHALIVFGVLQLLYLVRERSPAILFSIENAIIYLLGGCYLAFIFFCMPEYWRTILPMAMATYSTYSRGINGLYSIFTFIALIGPVFADFRPRFRSPMRSDIYYFLGVCVAYLLYALFNNGWSYTYNPLLSMARFLAGWVLMEFLWLEKDAQAQGQPVRQFVFGARACGLVLLVNVAFYLVFLGAFFVPFDCQASAPCVSTERFFEQVKRYPVHSFGAMSLEFYKWSELARQTHAAWDTRFNHLWMVPQFIVSDAAFAKEHQGIIDYVGEAYAEDLNSRKPEYMFVDASPMLFGSHKGIDFPAFFSSVPAFNEAFGHYRRVGVIDACYYPKGNEPYTKTVRTDCRFDVFEREPGS